MLDRDICVRTLMPIGLTAGHPLLIATGTNRNRIAAQMLPYNTAARNAFLRLRGTMSPDGPNLWSPSSAKWIAPVRETAILWAE